MLSDNRYSLLHFETVTSCLKNSLLELMQDQRFSIFRLVGGTNLSLKYGHRRSDDIDLFTDAEYGSVDFSLLEKTLKEHFPFVGSPSRVDVLSFGRMYYIGNSVNECVKLDLMYTDPFLYECDVYGDIRMASTKDIASMKIQAINTGARKKDFWDIHFLLDYFTLEEMIELHKNRHPYEHDRTEVISKLLNFSVVENEPNPNCLLNKDWEEIKMDLVDMIDGLQ